MFNFTVCQLEISEFFGAAPSDDSLPWSGDGAGATCRTCCASSGRTATLYSPSSATTRSRTSTDPVIADDSQTGGFDVIVDMLGRVCVTHLKLYPAWKPFSMEKRDERLARHILAATVVHNPHGVVRLKPRHVLLRRPHSLQASLKLENLSMRTPFNRKPRMAAAALSTAGCSLPFLDGSLWRTR